MPRHQQQSDPPAGRLSPFAVVGALSLVGLAVFFGLLGPQISDRGNVVLGPALEELLAGSSGYFQRERTELRMTTLSTSVPPDDIRRELLRRFDERAGFLDLGASGHRPIRIDTLEWMDPSQGDVIVVLYGSGNGRVRDGHLAALIYIDESKRRIAEDRFGVPMVMEPGLVYRSRIGGGEPGRDAWAAAWYEGTVLHVLLAESCDRLEEMLDSIERASDEEARPSGAIAGSDLARVALKARLT